MSPTPDLRAFGRCRDYEAETHPHSTEQDRSCQGEPS